MARVEHDQRSEESEPGDGLVRTEDEVSRLWWAVKRYAIFVVLVVAAAWLLAARILPQAQSDAITYEAKALIVAAELGIKVVELPRTVEAIFDSPAIAERVAENEDVPYAATDLVPEHASVSPIENSVVIEVSGFDSDPVVASILANRVATALADQLNEVGAGVGVFSVLDEARVPDEPMPSPGRALLVLIVSASAGFGAVGLIGLLLLARRPVVSVGEAETISGVAKLAALTFPRFAGRGFDPEQVLGLGALVKRLYAERGAEFIFVAPPGMESARTHVAALVAMMLAKDGRVSFVALSGRNRWGISRLMKSPNTTVFEQMPGGSFREATSVVIDGPSAARIDLGQRMPDGNRAVLVVPEGTRGVLLEIVADQLVSGSTAGFVFVRRPPRFPRLLGILGS